MLVATLETTSTVTFTCSIFLSSVHPASLLPQYLHISHIPTISRSHINHIPKFPCFRVLIFPYSHILISPYSHILPVLTYSLLQAPVPSSARQMVNTKRVLADVTRDGRGLSAQYDTMNARLVLSLHNIVKCQGNHELNTTQ